MTEIKSDSLRLATLALLFSALNAVVLSIWAAIAGGHGSVAGFLSPIIIILALLAIGIAVLSLSRAWRGRAGVAIIRAVAAIGLSAYLLALIIHG